MDLTRRRALALGGTAIAVTLVPISYAQAATEQTDAAISAFTGGVAPTEGGIDLTAPEIAENGNTVPISVEAEGAKRVTVLAAGNPNPGVATFNAVVTWARSLASSGITAKAETAGSSGERAWFANTSVIEIS